MFGNKQQDSLEKMDTVIGKGAFFKGDLKVEGTLRVDGKVEGMIDSQCDVVVGETGIVVAGIKARNLLVAGAVSGDVVVAGKLEIATSGKLEGNIATASLIIDDGALYKGACQMTTDAADAEKTKKKNGE